MCFRSGLCCFEHDRRVKQIAAAKAAGLLRDWVMDGHGQSWIVASGFTDNILFLLTPRVVQATINHLVVGSSPTLRARC
jgi:hypothetical protein